MSFFNQIDKNRKAPERPQFSEDKHVATLQAIAKYSKPVQKGLDNLEIEYKVNRRTKLCLCLLPEWDPSFPPYNTAKLASAAKRAGYDVKSFDINVDAWDSFKKDKWNMDFDPWDPLRDWHWLRRTLLQRYTRTLGTTTTGKDTRDCRFCTRCCRLHIVLL